MPPRGLVRGVLERIHSRLRAAADGRASLDVAGSGQPGGPPPPARESQQSDRDPAVLGAGSGEKDAPAIDPAGQLDAPRTPSPEESDELAGLPSLARLMAERLFAVLRPERARRLLEPGVSRASLSERRVSRDGGRGLTKLLTSSSNVSLVIIEGHDEPRYWSVLHAPSRRPGSRHSFRSR